MAQLTSTSPGKKSRSLTFTDTPRWIYAVLGAILGIVVGVVAVLLESVSLDTTFSPQLLLAIIPVAIIGIILVILSLRNAMLPFYLLVFSLILEDALKIRGLPNPIMVVLGGIVGLTIILHLIRRERRLSFSPIPTYVALLIVIWAALSAFAQNGSFSDIGTARPILLVFILFFYAQIMLQKRKHFVGLAWMLIISLSLVAAVMVLQQVAFLIQTGGSASANALHNNANHNLIFNAASGALGFRITKALPFAIYFALPLVEPIRRRRNILWIMTLTMIAGTVLTISINVIVGLATTLVLMVLYLPSRYRGPIFLAGILLSIIVFLTTPIGERVSNEVEVVLTSDDVLTWGSNRGLAWFVGIQAMRESPVFGLGPVQQELNQFSEQFATARFIRFKSSIDSVGLHPHNMYLDMGGRLGVPGLLLFLTLVGVTVIPLFRAVQTQRRQTPQSAGDWRWLFIGQALLIAHFAALIQGPAISSGLDPHYWLLFGTSVAYVRVFNTEKGRVLVKK